MGEWVRQTPWRQGSLLSGESAVALGLLQKDEADRRVLIAVSHDCDIANSNLHAEPTVEFVIGEIVEKIDGSYTRAKNARILHLAFETPKGKKAVSFSIRGRKDVDKTALSDHIPEMNWQHISPRGLDSLRWWLAARYFRSSFSDTFEARLKQSKLDQKIETHLSPHGEAVYGIYFLVDRGAVVQRADDDTHELLALIVYDAGADENQVTAIKLASSEIAAEFEKKFYDSHSKAWGKIELASCNAISDEAFSYSDSRLYKQWRLEYRSLEDNTQLLPLAGC